MPIWNFCTLRVSSGNLNWFLNCDKNPAFCASFPPLYKICVVRITGGLYPHILENYPAWIRIWKLAIVSCIQRKWKVQIANKSNVFKIASSHLKQIIQKMLLLRINKKKFRKVSFVSQLATRELEKPIFNNIVTLSRFQFSALNIFPVLRKTRKLGAKLGENIFVHHKHIFLGLFIQITFAVH